MTYDEIDAILHEVVAEIQDIQKRLNELGKKVWDTFKRIEQHNT